MQNPDLPTILSAGSCLIDSKSTKSPHLQAVLQSRLAEFRTRLGVSKCTKETSTLEEVELETAQEALYVVERVQHLLTVEGNDQHPSHVPTGHAVAAAIEETPMIGTRDLAMLRTILSIVFKWGVNPLLVRVASLWSRTALSQADSARKIVDSTATAHDHHLLASLLSRLMNIIFPRGLQSSVAQTLITTTILSRHVTELLSPCIFLGFPPKKFASESTPSADEFQTMVQRLLSMYVVSYVLLFLLIEMPPCKFASIPNYHHLGDYSVTQATASASCSTIVRINSQSTTPAS
jgi:hypothetical protein